MNFLTAESVHTVRKDIHTEQMVEVMVEQFFVCKKGAFGGYEHGGYAYAYGKTITEIKNGIDKYCPLEDINL